MAVEKSGSTFWDFLNENRSLMWVLFAFVLIGLTYLIIQKYTITTTGIIPPSDKQSAKKDSPNVVKSDGAINAKNVNTGTNYGHIGDEYNGVKQRKITPAFMNKILSLFPDKNIPIDIGKASNDPETTTYFNDLIDNLQRAGYGDITTHFLQILPNDSKKERITDTIQYHLDPHQLSFHVPAAKNSYP